MTHHRGKSAARKNIRSESQKKDGEATPVNGPACKYPIPNRVGDTKRGMKYHKKAGTAALEKKPDSGQPIEGSKTLTERLQEESPVSGTQYSTEGERKT